MFISPQFFQLLPETKNIIMREHNLMLQKARFKTHRRKLKNYQ